MDAFKAQLASLADLLQQHGGPYLLGAAVSLVRAWHWRSKRLVFY